MSEKDVRENIIEIINKIKPFLINDGGNIEFVDFVNGVVYVELLGACSDCPMIDVTLNDVIKSTLMSEVKEVKDVIVIN